MGQQGSWLTSQRVEEVGVAGEKVNLGFHGKGVRSGGKEAVLEPGWPQCWEARQEEERQDAFLVLAGCSETGRQVGSLHLYLFPCLTSGSGWGSVFSIVGSSRPHASPARWAWRLLQNGTIPHTARVRGEGPLLLLPHLPCHLLGCTG